MSEQTAYPLTWPEGWPRTAFNNRREWPGSKYSHRQHSMEDSSSFLQKQLELLSARKCVLSTNVERRLDGRPYSNRAQPNDRGAAVYFELKGKPTALACDRWHRVEDNIWCLAKHIEALRGQERWGVGSMEQAFRGYTALPGIGESSASTWWQTLGVPINADAAQVRDAYRVLVKKHHPDRGGDRELFDRVQRAMERFEATLKAPAPV